MASSWDEWLKKLVQIRPQDFATWLLADAKFEAIVSPALLSRNPQADMLLRTTLFGKKVLLHIEFQTKRDSKMARRVLEYNILADLQYNMPVYSCVVYLRSAARKARSPYARCLPNGSLIHQFRFDSIELGRLQPEELLAKGPTTLLALLPLTKGGKSPMVIEQMVTTLKARNEPDILGLGVLLAGAVSQDEEFMQGLLRRVKEMFNENFEENVIVRLLKEEGREEGRAAGKVEGRVEGKKEGRVEGVKEAQDAGRRALVDGVFMPMIRSRFPELAPLAQKRADALHESSQLHELISKFFWIHTIEEARAALEEEES